VYVVRHTAHMMMKIRDVFAVHIVRDLPRSEVRMLVAHVLARDHAWLVAHDDDVLSDEDFTQIESLIARRAHGEPIAYLIGARDFYGRSFRCSPAALIPRPETELLVDCVLALAPSSVVSRVQNILDIGTGTGCIAITLAIELPHASVTAIDVSAEALSLARDNATQLNASVNFIESNWFAALNADAKFDIIVSNPPYIAPGDAHLSQGDLRFEPGIALTDAIDGLESYRQLAHGARKHLRAGGTLIVEHGYDQGDSVPALFRDAGFVDVEMIRDLANQPRVTRCKIPRPA
jgi:release factor glutamine methyltransferase